MYRHGLFRFWLVFGICLVGRLQVEAATVQLNNDPDILIGNGIGANSGGQLDGTVDFTTNIVTSNADNVDRAFFLSLDDYVLTWIDDVSSGQTDWNSSFTFDFPMPISGIKIIPETAVNTSDSVLWDVRWTGSSNTATFVNSPDTLNEHSLYSGNTRLPDGSYVSGTVFRMDDDGAFGQDTNGTTPNDLNLSKPTTPWVIGLPDDITSLTIRATLADAGNTNRRAEGFAVDFSDVVIPPPVPEPSHLSMPLLIALVIYLRRR